MKILESRPRFYDRLMNKASGGRVEYIKKAVAAELRGTERVLEIGCGTGQLAAMLAVQGMKVDGFDVSPGMVEIATQRILRENLKNHFSVRMMGVDAMDTLPDASYDAVVSTLVFSELSDDERLFAVKHAARVLKTNGLIVIADEVLPRKSLSKLLYAVARTPMLLATYLFSRAKTRPIPDLSGDLNAAGFKVEKEIRSCGDSFALIVGRFAKK